MRKLNLTFLILGFSFNAAVFAQTADPSDQTKSALETVVVTAASGRSEEIFDVPMTIDVVAPESAAAAQPLWIGEVLNKLPGVYFAQLRGPVDMPAIRLPLSSDNTELYLQDNVPLQSPISFNHAAFAYSGALTSPGGMEVLKGPGTALHGSDAFAAVINVLSRAPTSQMTANSRIATGSHGAREARGEFSRALGQTQALRLAASYTESAGWREQTGWERKQAIVRHRWGGDRTEINTILTATDFDSEMAGALTGSFFQSDPRNDGLDLRVPRDRAVDSAKYVRLSSEITHSLTDTYRAQITPYFRSIDSSYMATWEPATVPVTDEKTTTSGLISRLYADWSSDSQTIVGFDVESTKLDELVTQVVPTTIVFGDVYPQGAHFDYEVDYSNVAPYMQHTQRLGESWQWVAGLRYERTRYDYENHLSSGAHDAFYRPGDRRDELTALNPKLGVTWTFAHGQNLFARYAHGFRIPSASSLYALSSSQTDFALDPEQINSYEIGYKGVLGDRIALTAATYLMRSYDGLTTGVATLAGTVTANGGRREYEGLEAQLDVRITDTLSGTLAGALQRSKIVRDRPDGSDPRGVNGNTVNSQPSRLANLSLSWSPRVAGRAVALDYDLQLLGSWWIDDQNTRKTPTEVVSHVRARVEVGAGWALTAKAINLFDRKYATTAADTGFGARYRPADPRTVVLGIEYAL